MTGLLITRWTTWKATPSRSNASWSWQKILMGSSGLLQECRCRWLTKHLRNRLRSLGTMWVKSFISGNRYWSSRSGARASGINFLMSERRMRGRSALKLLRSARWPGPTIIRFGQADIGHLTTFGSSVALSKDQIWWRSLHGRKSIIRGWMSPIGWFFG